MDELRSYFTKPEFWAVTVGLSLVLSVVGNYLTRWLDRVYGKGTGWWAKRSEKRRTLLEEEVRALVRFPVYRTSIERRHLAQSHHAIFLGVTAVITSVAALRPAAGRMLEWLGLALGVLALVSYYRAMQFAFSLQEADEALVLEESVRQHSDASDAIKATIKATFTEIKPGRNRDA